MRPVLQRLVPWAPALLAASAYAWASIYRHDHYGSNAYDLGIFDQTVWGYSRLDWIPNTVLRVPHALGDHFDPIVMLATPLYWIWSDPRMLLLAQAALLALASVPIFWFARNRLGVAPAVVVQVAYLAFWGVLGGDLFDFHEVAFAAPLIAFALLGALERRDRLLLVSCGLLLLTKEDLALTVAALGVYLGLTQRRWRLGLGLAAASLVWFVVAIEAVLPAIAGGRYSHWTYTALGSGPGSASQHLLTHPLSSARLFVSPEAKRVALANLYVPWLLLPLASPLLLVMLPSLAERFFSANPSYWAQGFHYSLVIAPILAFGAVDTLARSRRRHTRAPLALAALALLVGLFFSFGRLKPWDELRRYTPASHLAEIDRCLRVIPAHASVAATSALVPHLSRRREIYQLDDRPPPRTDWRAFDATTWIYPLSGKDVQALIRRSEREGYRVRCAVGGTTVLERT